MTLVAATAMPYGDTASIIATINRILLFYQSGKWFALVQSISFYSDLPTASR
jgi:hypothetical protein